MKRFDEFARGLTRRSFLGHGSLGLGAAAMGSLFDTDAIGVDKVGGVIDPLHHPARAKRVIFLCMAGGPLQFETFDYKPELERLDGQAMPASYTAGQPIAQLQGKKLRVLRPLTKFRKHGACGRMVSDFMPYTAQIVDDIAVIKSMTTTQINHDPAHTVMNTGTQISGRPSMGSWITYGLGSDARDLPGFVVLSSAKGRNPQPIAARQWHSGFLPSRFQGVEFHAHGDPVHYLSNPPGITAARQRDVVDTVNQLDRIYNGGVHDPEIEARLSQYEMAFRMQTSVPELMDFRDEPQHILDLKQRGMLEDTLLVWGGEFGRTPMFQGKGRTPGRDHHIRCFSMWMAGGGIKGGISYGESDDLGYGVAENEVRVHDLHATMLHLLGIDHERFTKRFQGLDVKLTGVERSRVVTELLA